MKTAISLPDKVHRDADRLARRLGKSRSRVYTEAIQLYLARYDSEAVTDALNAVCDATDTGLDPALEAAAVGTLSRSAW
jgi:predicted transcriptional regulator